MKAFKVTIKEELIYHIEVIAENEDKAVDEAYNSSKFINNVCDENDSVATEVEDLGEVEEEYEE